jgi:4-amino-4-deoxy-L-arabinose transferase-like glycosyltransferase
VSRAQAATAAVALAVICGLVLLERWHAYDEPLDRDVATYAVIAREMRRGRALYTDLWDNKPPAVYGIYAAAQAVAGEGPGSVFLIGFVSASIAALALFAAGAFGSGIQAGLWTAAFWALLSADLPLEADQPNVEALLNAGLALAFAALLRVGAAAWDWRALAAGASLALATLLKPVVVPIAVALALVHVIRPAAGVSRRRALRQAGLVLGLCATASLAVAAYFALDGRGADFWNTLVVHNRYYTGPLLPNLREGLRPARLFPPALRHALPLAVAAVPGALLALRERRSRRAVLLGAWLVATPLVVSAPGKFFPHYYQVWLPPLCVAAGWSIAEIARRTARPALVTTGAGAMVVLALAVELAPAYALSADEWSQSKYGDVFVRSRDVARDIESMIAPAETFFQWGNEPELYLYARRPPPTGVLWAQHLQYGPLRIPLRMRALRQLSEADPQLVVFSRDQPPPPGALGQWFAERYAPHPHVRRRAGFRFWVRRGGPLQRRLVGDSGR